MGDISDMILEGTMCQECGAIIGDVLDEGYDPPGYPRTCSACSAEDWGEYEEEEND